jgi:hypothetical protein
MPDVNPVERASTTSLNRQKAPMHPHMTEEQHMESFPDRLRLKTSPPPQEIFSYPKELPVVPPIPYENWVLLNPDDEVVVQRVGEQPASGTVDVVADDASIIWIWLDGGRGRIAVWEEDGSYLWRGHTNRPF